VRAIFLAAFLVACGSKAKPAQTFEVIVDQTGDGAAEIVVPPPKFRLVGAINDAVTGQRPSLEPHYRVTSPWTVVCERRWRLADDALAYVEAWCKKVTNPRFDLMDTLMALRSSAVPGLGLAIKRDIANMIAESSGEQALAWAGSDAEWLGLLFGLYLDFDQVHDAEVIAKELGKKATCEGSLAKLMFDFDPDHLPDLGALIRRHGVTTACGVALQRLACLVRIGEGEGLMPQSSECAGLTIEEDDKSAAHAIAARILWSKKPSTAKDLLAIAELAAAGLVVQDAEQLALDALELALRISCTSETIAAAQTIAARIQTQDRAKERHAEHRATFMRRTTVTNCLR
jgi:hypothetical protein